MKKIIFLFLALNIFGVAYAASVFDSMDTASEVKLAPTIRATSSSNLKPVSSSEAPVAKAATTPAVNKTSSTIKEQKFNNALINLDDAQVELRQELSVLNAKYTQALDEKQKACQNCKSLKKEINNINKKMRNVEKSKKMINKNLGNAQ